MFSDFRSQLTTEDQVQTQPARWLHSCAPWGQGQGERHRYGKGCRRQALTTPLQPKPTEGAVSSPADGLPSPRGLMSDNQTEAARPGLAFRLQAENQTKPEWVRFLPGPLSPAVGRKNGFL